MLEYKCTYRTKQYITGKFMICGEKDGKKKNWA